MSADNDPVSPGKRLEALEELLDDLIEANADVPVLVEGPKDVAALRELGLHGEILILNAGASLVARVEALHEGGVREIILLLDWDRTGGRLARRLRELFDTHGVKWDDRHRQALVRVVGNEARSVESLATLRESLRRRASGA